MDLANIYVDNLEEDPFTNGFSVPNPMMKSMSESSSSERMSAQTSLSDLFGDSTNDHESSRGSYENMHTMNSPPSMDYSNPMRMEAATAKAKARADEEAAEAEEDDTEGCYFPLELLQIPPYPDG